MKKGVIVLILIFLIAFSVSGWGYPQLSKKVDIPITFEINSEKETNLQNEKLIEGEYVPGQIVVKFKESNSKVTYIDSLQINDPTLAKIKSSKKIFADSNKNQKKFREKGLDRWVLIEVDENIDLESELNKYKNNPLVEYAELNHVFKLEPIEHSSEDELEMLKQFSMDNDLPLELNIGKKQFTAIEEITSNSTCSGSCLDVPCHIADCEPLLIEGYCGSIYSYCCDCSMQGVHPENNQCNDGIDNDGDGCIDFPNDKYDCTSEGDLTENGTDCGDFPLDPFLGQQWYLEHFGQYIGVVDSDIDAIDAWNVETGSEDVVIAIVDTGVDYNHEDLRNKIWVNTDEIPENGIDDDGNGYIDDHNGYDFCTYGSCGGTTDNDPMDEHSYGTHVAGIAAAESNNIINHTDSQEGEVYAGGGARDKDVQGIANVNGQFMVTATYDNNIYRRNYYGVGEELFTAPTNDPTGITYTGTSYWISDPTLDLIYEVPILSGNSVSGTKLKLEIQNPLTDYGVRIYELGIYNYNDLSTNLALGATVNASPLNYNPGNYSSPEYINDDNMTTRWGPYGMFGESFPATIELDFGGYVNFNLISILSMTPSYALANYTISVWDGDSWNLIFNITNNQNYNIAHSIGEIPGYSMGRSFPSPGTDPRGLDWDGQYFWNVDGDTNRVYQIDINGNVIQSFSLDDPESWGVTLGGNYVWITGDSTDKTYKYNLDGDLISSFDCAMRQYWGPYDPSHARGLTWIPESDTYIEMDDYRVGDSASFYVNPWYLEEYSYSGIAGVCWGCKIMPLRFINAEGYGTDTDVAPALRYAADNGADIISNSWGGSQSSPLIEDAIDYAKEVSIIVASAGNSASYWKTNYPSDYDGVISVASSDYYNKRSSFSNFGDYSDKRVDITAPGSSVYSTLPGNQYDYLQGTSMAAPVVSGVLGLIKSQHPEWSNERIQAQLLSTTDPAYAPGYLTYYGMMGSGKVNAYNSVTETIGPSMFIRRYSILDGSGDNDGFVDPGETVDFEIVLRNNGDYAADVYVVLSTNDSDVIILRDNVIYDDMSPMDLRIGTFSFSLNSNASHSQIINFSLAVFAQGGYEELIPFEIEVPMQIKDGFPIVDIYYGPAESSTIADIDGNGDLEVVLIGPSPSTALYMPVSVFNDDGTEWIFRGWPYELGQMNNVYAEPLVIDIDHDGKLEVFIAVQDSFNFNGGNRIVGLDDDGTVLDGWPIVVAPSDVNYLSEVSARDLNNDGDYEIIVNSRGYNVPQQLHILHGDGTYYSGYPIYFPQESHNPTFYDINRDGVLEMFYVDGNRWLNGKYLDGTDITGYPIQDQWAGTPQGGTEVVIADIDNDGDNELLAGLDKFFVVNPSNGGIIWTLPEGGYDTQFKDLSVGDLDGDGDLEVITVRGMYLSVHDHNGNQIPGDWPKYINEISQDYKWDMPMIADVDADGINEVVIYSEGGFIQAWNVDGSAVKNFPILRYGGRPNIVDLDQDGNLDIVSGGERTFAFDLEVEDTGVYEWPMYRHDLFHTNKNGFVVPNHVITCSDGTINGNCVVNTIPKYCDSGIIVDNCQECGCGPGTCCKEDGYCGKCSPINPDIRPMQALPEGGEFSPSYSFNEKIKGYLGRLFYY